MAKKKTKQKIPKYAWVVLAIAILIGIMIMTSGEGGTLAKFSAARNTMPSLQVTSTSATISIDPLAVEDLYDSSGKLSCAGCKVIELSASGGTKNGFLISSLNKGTDGIAIDLSKPNTPKIYYKDQDKGNHFTYAGLYGQISGSATIPWTVA